MRISEAEVTRDEVGVAREWAASHLLDATEPPFSLKCDGHPLGELIHTWGLTRQTVALERERTRHTLVWSDLDTGLQLRCVAVVYTDFPVVEWTLYLKNTGGVDTPILWDVMPIDADFSRSAEGPVVFHHATGSPARADDYAPISDTLPPRSTTRIATRGGRGSDSDLPYFDVEWPGAGLILAVGWPGQWSASFERDAEAGLRVRAGQEVTHFKLLPGEEVRTPLVALLFYRGDWVRGQNLWRRWMIDYNLPRVHGRLPTPILAASSSAEFHEMERADESNQKAFVDRYLEEGIGLDYWWMDAGWYVDGAKSWQQTGTWEVDPKRFPNGLRAVAEHAHALGVKALVWFEPERVAPGSWLDAHHPEWLLEIPGGRWKLLDLGNPEAWRWAVDHFDRLVVEQGVDLYRQDFNMPPLEYWRANDAPDRQGISEIKHVMGYLAYWDELRRRHPDMLIDTCASGGRRNDLETLRRAVPLHRSDHDYDDFEARQSQAYGIAFWMPFHGAPVCRRDQVDAYAFRSGVGLLLGLGYDVRRADLDYGLLRRLTEEWRRIVDYLYGDYYPLTSYSVDRCDWLAWQYDRPDRGDGMVQVFRRSESPFVSAKLCLRRLEPEATYRLRNLDDASATLELSGRKLREVGLGVTLRQRSTALIVTYERVEQD